MRAVGLTRTGGPEVLEVLDLPEPEAADALVIETAAAAVNPVDLATRSGLIPTSLPAVLGWDLAGTVAHAPAGSGFRTGDRVLAMTAQLGTGVGSMAEYVAFDPGFVAHVPDGMKLEQAAALPLAGVSVAEAAARGIAPRQDLTVLPFEDAAEAHRRLERGGFRGKLLLAP
ncbi:alcohol dehydrogenase catalytic domain-containing protein [Streptomyces sp. NPDC048420]|uniref:alcohol dehydrogenase catalytic domain-containing protein n=1 Tax=Streptomyces sp. NPDC048420 TaxID=3155755 RepID=UPI00342B35ED